jgi:hypothetical protein
MVHGLKSANQTVAPIVATRWDFHAPGVPKVLGCGGRQARAPVAHFSRYLRLAMTRLAAILGAFLTDAQLRILCGESLPRLQSQPPMASNRPSLP